MTTQEDITDSIVQLPDILNLAVAENLRDTFIQHLTVETRLTLDAQMVDTITTPCIQVIIAAGQSLEENGNSLAVINPSPAFTAAFSDLGFTDFFDKWSST